MSEIENKGLYKIVCGLHKVINKIGTNLSNAAEKLRYIKFKMEFGERDDDIYIVTYPKSGTTLTQMILYQLTTDGNLNFNHIYDVSPWIRNDSYKKKDPRDLPSPRLIKSHDPYNDYDKETKGRFIYVYRNGMDVAVSMFHQRKNYGHPDLDFNKFIESFYLDNKMNWFKFNKEWLRNKNRLPILFLTYEDLLNNLDDCLDKIIKFCKLDKSKIDIDRVKERSSFDFMKKYQDKFGEQPVEAPPFVYDQFIRKGSVGSGKEKFTAEQKEKFKLEYTKHLLKYEPILNNKFKLKPFKVKIED